METIDYDGVSYSVREVARPEGWSCRLLVTDDGATYFLEYLVSVGPYKIDVARIHKLSAEEVRAYTAGGLRLGELARQLAETSKSQGAAPAD
ncbi:MAG TPA: hypothetical protein VFJ82_11875 [Longimicrobium sp.]|nr:hypothetical protein [Longimicrobium sp.]